MNKKIVLGACWVAAMLAMVGCQSGGTRTSSRPSGSSGGMARSSTPGRNAMARQPTPTNMQTVGSQNAPLGGAGTTSGFPQASTGSAQPTGSGPVGGFNSNVTPTGFNSTPRTGQVVPASALNTQSDNLPLGPSLGTTPRTTALPANGLSDIPAPMPPSFPSSGLGTR